MGGETGSSADSGLSLVAVVIGWLAKCANQWRERSNIDEAPTVQYILRIELSLDVGHHRERRVDRAPDALMRHFSARRIRQNHHVAAMGRGHWLQIAHQRP